MLTPLTLPCYLTINQSEHCVWADHIPWKLPFLALPLFYLFIYFRFNPKYLYFLFYLFFNFTILYSFSHISTWLRHRYTCVPHPCLAFKNGSQKPIQKFRTFKHQLPGLLAWHLQNTLPFPQTSVSRLTLLLSGKWIPVWFSNKPTHIKMHISVASNSP